MQIRAAAANINNPNGKMNNAHLFNEINHERKKLGRKIFQIHLTLQFAAEKRCSNQDELIETYEKMILKLYKDDDWPKQEQLNKIFPYVSETIYLNGLNIRDEIFYKSFFISNFYRTNFVYIGIAMYQYKNFSARCVLYGSANNFTSNHQRILRLLYILISCGIILLSLIICSIINDRRQAKLKQEIMDDKHTIVPKKSVTVFIDRDRKSSSKRGDINRMTMARLDSMTDNERSSAVHSFSQSSK
ncbi:unnamed protein product [Adineta steineri]|nr:unnamed protein product [Adineta steineri]